MKQKERKCHLTPIEGLTIGGEKREKGIGFALVLQHNHPQRGRVLMKEK